MIVTLTKEEVKVAIKTYLEDYHGKLLDEFGVKNTDALTLHFTYEHEVVIELKEEDTA